MWNPLPRTPITAVLGVLMLFSRKRLCQHNDLLPFI